MSNLLKDFLPDAPRETGLLVAAAGAGLPGMLGDHLAQGMDPATAARLTASSLAAATAFGLEACEWVTAELAIALGLASPGEPGDRDRATAAPGGIGADATLAPPAPETAGAVTSPPDQGQWAAPGQPPAAGQWAAAGQPGYPVPGQQAGFGYPPPAATLPTASLWQRRRGSLIAAGIAVVAVIAVGAALLVHALTSPKGSTSFPGTLLGLHMNTSQESRLIDRQLIREIASSARGKVLHPAAAVYGDPAGAAFAVVGGGICGTCYPKSAADAMAAINVPGIQSFSPGPKGGVVLCAPHSTDFWCWWFDHRTAGYIAFVGGTSTGLTDAAAKVNEIRAAIEH